MATKPLAELTGWEELEVAEAAAPASTSSLPVSPTKRASRQKLKRQRDAADAALHVSELKRATGVAPTTAGEFEALLMASPSSSYVWTRFMAWHTALGDVPAARAVGERALRAIGLEETRERLNIWLALLNLELHHSRDDARALACLSRAASHCDSKRLYLAAVDAMEETGHAGALEQTLALLQRRFSQDALVWLRVIKSRLTGGRAGSRRRAGKGERNGGSEGGESRKDEDADDANPASSAAPSASTLLERATEARKAMDRALQCIASAEHPAFLSRVGVLEFQLGDRERGRSVFEGVVRSFPRRLDLWGVYLDQEMGVPGGQPRVRALFERATSLELPPKRIKVLFKKYLAYEKQHGDEASVEHVKRRALEYVARVTGED
ncbi:hypothetical protein H632_c92p0 [Helicosporidium sp. ATCC 50920]|nr:hypothetical protein H632_c92p0 [Helicosporidium sp. ATCC 50920]|eukprot:KDD76832.1 hypothetical protein H632_c92p0 [Helicosporidium sp. ATCC 50920]